MANYELKNKNASHADDMLIIITMHKMTYEYTMNNSINRSYNSKHGDIQIVINGKHTPTAVVAKKAILFSPDIRTPNDGCIGKFFLNSKF